MRELNGEKIDIIRFSEDIETYIKNAMAPAELLQIKLNETERRAEILVADDQLSLAIGKRGQNVRLASKLIGWELDVRSKSQMIPLTELDGVDEKIEAALKKAGAKTIKDVFKMTVEDLVKIEGIDEKLAERIRQAVEQVLAKKTEAQEAPVRQESAEETGS